MGSQLQHQATGGVLVTSHLISSTSITREHTNCQAAD